MTLKANISGLRETTRNAKRGDSLYREIVVLDPATGRAIVTARLYWPGEVTCYASVWIYGNRGAVRSYGRGQGKAGGYGYHKPSAALADAISDAGITLHGDVYGREKTNARAYISGVGDSAMESACEAIARAVTGKRRFIVHTAHP